MGQPHRSRPSTHASCWNRNKMYLKQPLILAKTLYFNPLVLDPTDYEKAAPLWYGLGQP